MPAIFERSLIKMGKGGLVVTLPKAWVSYLHLKARDRVILVCNRKVVIYPKSKGGDS